jgi:DNA-binding SARP family transcriptional activator
MVSTGRGGRDFDEGLGPAQQHLRIQLCGRFTIERDGERIESKLPGRQGRTLLGYLIMNDDHPTGRDELADAIWGAEGAGVGDALSPLVSKLRKALGPERIEGRSEIRFVEDDGTFVDAKQAIEALHVAESSAESKDWARVWSTAHSAYHIAKRPFMLGMEAPWIDEWRRRFGAIKDRGLTLFAESGLGLGATALGPAERAARSVIEASPFNETGYRILMEVLQVRGNRAEALLVYDRLKGLLRDELGVDPSPALQEVYLKLLG